MLAALERTTRKWTGGTAGEGYEAFERSNSVSTLAAGRFICNLFVAKRHEGETVSVLAEPRYAGGQAVPYCLVGMCQGVSMGRENSGYFGLATHGILSCTGLVLISPHDIFLAHIPPVEGMDPLRFRSRVKRMTSRALQYMNSPVAGAIVSPDDMWRSNWDYWTAAQPNSGKVLSGITIEGPSFNIRLEYKRGNMVRVSRDPSITVGFGTIPANESRSIGGGTTDDWLFRRL